MDRPSTGLDFAIIGHQDNWVHIADFINGIRTAARDHLSVEKIKELFSFIPPRDLFRVTVQSATGTEINGVYIDTFIDPDKLDLRFARPNISKVMQGIAFAKKMNAKIAALGGFTSIVLEGNMDAFSAGNTKFTTGNTLTAAYIVKAIEKAAGDTGIKLPGADLLIIGATGDIGMACVHYFKNKVKRLLLCARNFHRLEQLAQRLSKENIAVKYAACLQELIPEADVIISVASSTGIQMVNYKKNVLVCDAGYPKNLAEKMNGNSAIHLFHGGMGQVSQGFSFHPDYSDTIYRYPAPHIIHGCILEAMVLAFEMKFENYSSGKGNIAIESIEEIYTLSLKHGIELAPFFNEKGLW